MRWSLLQRRSTHLCTLLLLIQCLARLLALVLPVQTKSGGKASPCECSKEEACNPFFLVQYTQSVAAL